MATLTPLGHCACVRRCCRVQTSGWGQHHPSAERVVEGGRDDGNETPSAGTGPAGSMPPAFAAPQIRAGEEEGERGTHGGCALCARWTSSSSRPAAGQGRGRQLWGGASFRVPEEACSGGIQIQARPQQLPAGTLLRLNLRAGAALPSAPQGSGTAVPPVPQAARGAPAACVPDLRFASRGLTHPRDPPRGAGSTGAARGGAGRWLPPCCPPWPQPGL